jgi:hypothetical protein
VIPAAANVAAGGGTTVVVMSGGGSDGPLVGTLNQHLHGTKVTAGQASREITWELRKIRRGSRT